MGDSPFQAPALQVLWQAIVSDPMNFQSWTALLSQVESAGSPDGAHRAYDEFLRQFPLCFGYWNKYANLARRHPATAGGDGGGAGRDGDSERGSPGDRRARDVYERAVVAAPFCLELWEAFVEEVVGKGGGAGGGKGGGVPDGGGGGGGRTAEDTRRVVEQALEAVGDNPGSGPLWRRCVAFEEAQNDEHSALRITRLYERAFGCRLKELEVLWISFKEFVDRTPWEKLESPVLPSVSPNDAVLANILDKKRKAVVAAAAGCKGADAAIAVATSTEDNFNTDAEKKAMLIKILEKRRKVSLSAREEREAFERRITRPHFHVKPLDDAQLSAWSQYIDFEQAQAEGAPGTAAAAAAAAPNGSNSSSGAQASPSRAGRKRPRAGEGGDNDGGSSGDGGSHRNEEIRRLFERCLVPCASYWWLWERYALWKESVSGLESALEVAERACSPFLRWRPEASFYRAELLERLGRKDEARGMYERVLSEVAPGLVEGACKLACFERRCGNLEAASAAYRSLLPPPLGPLSTGGAGASGGDVFGSSSSYLEETTETTRPYLYMQLARFQHRVVGDPGSARATFRAAVSDIPGNRELWLAFLEFEAAQPQALHSGRVEAAFRMAVKENDGVEDDFHDDDDDDTDARRLTVEDRADLWEWFEEFVEDLSMDIAKVMSVRADHKAWVRNHGMGAHEADAAAAAVASAAASTAASGVSNSGGDRPQDLKSSDRKKRSNCHGKNPGGDPTATVDLRGAPQVERHQRQNAATAAAGGGGGGNAGSVVFAGGGSGAGVAGVGAASVGPALWAGAGAMGADGGALAHPEDQQRRDAWSAYYTQQQQQQAMHQHMMTASALVTAGAGAGAAGGGAAQPAGIGLLSRPTMPTSLPTARADTLDTMHPAGGVVSSPSPAYFVGGAGVSAPSLQQPQHLQHLQQQQQQQQQQVDAQLQNQQAMHGPLYGASYHPPSR